MPSTILVREVNHPFDERDVCQVTELWHDYQYNKKDLPNMLRGTVIPCLVRRKALSDDGSPTWETVTDNYYFREKAFENTPFDRLSHWCYLDDLEPRKHVGPLYEVEERGDYYYVVIDIKDFYEDHFYELEPEDETFRALYETFADYEDGLCYIGQVGFPIEDTNYGEFYNYIHLYCVRFVNNGQTLLVSRNRLVLEMTVALDNKTRMLKI